MVMELPQFKPRMRGMKVRYPPWMAKSILKQSLEALAFLHENGIAHGDFQPGNMLFALDNIDNQPMSELRQDEDVEAGSISPPVQRLDSKKDKWAPQYLCIAQTLAPYTKYSEGFKIKLSDMGGAYFFTDPSVKPITSGGLRAPELVLSESVHKSLDIWSYGCLVYEIVTGTPIFCVPWLESESEQDDDHLLLMTARLGPLPEELYTLWKRSSLYFTPDRELLDPDLEGVDKDGAAYISAHKSMEEAFDKAGPDMSEEEALVVKRLIRRILQCDPTQRPSAADILRDPWFCEQDVGSGSPKEG